MAKVIRIAVLTGGVLLALGLLSGRASADVADPRPPVSPLGPRATATSEEPAAEAPKPAASRDAPAAEPAPEPAPQQAAPADQQPAVEQPAEQSQPVAAALLSAAVDAPEEPAKQTSQSPRKVGRNDHTLSEAETSLPSLPSAFLTGVSKIRTVLRDVVEACQVAAGAATGGPVLPLLAVLGTIGLMHTGWAVACRRFGDERVPQLLYARDVIAPG